LDFDHNLRLPPELPKPVRDPRTQQNESYEGEFETNEEYEFLWNEYDPFSFAENIHENILDPNIEQTASGPIIYLPENAQQPIY